MNPNLKTVALAASLVTLFTACGTNHENSSRNKNAAALAAQGEKTVTAMTLKSVFGGIDGYSENDHTVSDSFSQETLSYVRDEQTKGSASISGGLRSMNFAIQLSDGGNSIILASLDDTRKLKLNTAVDMTVSSNDEVNTAIGGTPRVRAVCANADCNTVGVLVTVQVKTPSGVGEIAAQYANAGYIFQGTNKVQSQPTSSAPTLPAVTKDAPKTDSTAKADTEDNAT